MPGGELKTEAASRSDGVDNRKDATFEDSDHLVPAESNTAKGQPGITTEEFKSCEVSTASSQCHLGAEFTNARTTRELAQLQKSQPSIDVTRSGLSRITPQYDHTQSTDDSRPARGSSGRVSDTLRKIVGAPTRRSRLSHDSKAEEIMEEQQRHCQNELEELSDWMHRQEAGSDDHENVEVPQIDPEMIEHMLSVEYEMLFKYKNRYVTGTLLHYAVYQSAKDNDATARLVEVALAAGAPPRSPAQYMLGDKKGAPWVVLEAIHFAAGFGHIPSMQRLLKVQASISIADGAGVGHSWSLGKFSEAHELMNAYCTINVENKDPEQFYCPIHDAVFCGQMDAIQWLLEHKADPKLENMHNFYTPLHWLAYLGGEPQDKLEKIVILMLERKARLDVRTSADRGKEHLQNKLPLEVALAPGSSYPAELAYLLATSWNLTHGSILKDVCVLSNYNRKAAEELAKQFAERAENPDCMAHIIRAACTKGSAEAIAHIILTAPSAAARLLEMLLVKPEVEANYHHPLSKRGSLNGWVSDVNMRCAYSPDVKERKLSNDEYIEWPCWRYDPKKELEEQPEVHWHSSLITTPRQKFGLNTYIYDIETKALMLPDILDITVFMALCRVTERSQLTIFEALPAKGMISCIWTQLIMRVFVASVLMYSVELILLIWWGADTSSTDGYASLEAPVCWTVITAGTLRDSVNLMWWFGAHVSQWIKWTRRKQEAKQREDAANIAISSCEDAANIAICKALKIMWRPTHFWRGTSAVHSCTLIIIRTVFLWRTRRVEPGSMSVFQQTLLAIIVMMLFVRIFNCFMIMTHLWKVQLIFSSTFLSGAMGQMAGIACYVYLALCISFMILAPGETVGWILVMLQRSFIFGDGDSFEEVGLSPSEERVALAVVMFAGTALFNIVVLNLFIAIYTHCYEHLSNTADILFEQARVNFICKYLLSLQKLPALRPRWQIAMWLLTHLSFLSVAGLLFFINEEQAVRDDHYFSVALRCFVASVFAFAQIMWQALWMQSQRVTTKGSWGNSLRACFQPAEDGQSTNYSQNFLWISYRSDFRQGSCLEASMEGLSGMLSDLTQKVDKLASGSRDARTRSSDKEERKATIDLDQQIIRPSVSFKSGIQDGVTRGKSLGRVVDDDLDGLVTTKSGITQQLRRRRPSEEKGDGPTLPALTVDTASTGNSGREVYPEVASPVTLRMSPSGGNPHLFRRTTFEDERYERLAQTVSSLENKIDRLVRLQQRDGMFQQL